MAVVDFLEVRILVITRWVLYRNNMLLGLVFRRRVARGNSFGQRRQGQRSTGAELFIHTFVT